MISVIVPVKDGGEDLRRCLDALEHQRLDEPVEVLVVDSGSRDGSRELAKARGARVIDVSASDFLHGATRNLAAEQATSDILVFTTQDAYAADDDWLATLCRTVRADDRMRMPRRQSASSWISSTGRSRDYNVPRVKRS